MKREIHPCPAAVSSDSTNLTEPETPAGLERIPDQMLKSMDEAVRNMNRGIVSDPVDLSGF